MEEYENRVINGLLKGQLGETSPEELLVCLAIDVSIVVDAERLQKNDLWPCVWALAKVLEKQFLGKIYICTAGNPECSGPSKLSDRVLFVNKIVESSITIGVGIRPTKPINGRFIWGDARGSSITYDSLLEGSAAAHPISCFALAGYLGFAALAIAAGIPAFRSEYTQKRLDLPFFVDGSRQFTDEIVLIGLGQLGQAYLALWYFLHNPVEQQIVFLDKDTFEKPNYNTQILIEEDRKWLNKPKADFLAAKFNNLGWKVQAEVTELKWPWSRPTNHGPIVMLGLDNFDVRRIAVNAGYDWVFEAGLGTSFLEPKLSWHSIPGKTHFETLFPNIPTSVEAGPPVSEFETSLHTSTPGGCGLVTYRNIAASAPSMGLVASAYVWCEVLSYHNHQNIPVKGNACLWSPILPFFRESLGL